MTTVPYRRRVGSARPSHLMFTGGVGGLVELPNFTVLVRGLDDWSYARLPEHPVIDEPRLLAAVRRELGPGVKELRSPPWLEGQGDDPNGPAGQVGVPVVPFPSWFRCTRCNQLMSLDSGAFTFDNKYASRPFDAQFRHRNCHRKDQFAVPARFLVGCLNGHLDEFPYAWFVHQGGSCPAETYPALVMNDRGGTEAANVSITCKSCGAARNLNQAQGRKGMERLPACRGRHPHRGTFEPEPCGEPSRLLILGASNQWFGKNVLTMSVPPTEGRQLDAVLDRMWERLEAVTSREVMAFAYEQPNFSELQRWSLDEVWTAMAARRSTGGPSAPDDSGDLLGPEWEVLTHVPTSAATEDFAVRQVPVPEVGRGMLADLRQVERLRLVRALVGFSRFDAPDPQEPDLVTIAPLSRAKTPEWVPATEVRGEGIFIRLDEDLVRAWEDRLRTKPVGDQHRSAFARFRANRYADRQARPADWDWSHGWPGLRYYLVHTLAHGTLRAIALECGYAAASLAERIYATEGGPGAGHAGFLIYTAVPDAEGTLGGLVSLGESDRFARILSRALDDARECSSDPLCAERAPVGDSDALHAAACHVCLFLSETSCERGNRFLDRRLLVPVGEDPSLAYWTA